MECLKCKNDLKVINYIETDWGCRLVYVCHECGNVYVKNVCVKENDLVCL